MAERTDVATRMRASNIEPERSAEEIRQDIAAKRESISETVDKLGDRIHQTLDWREYIAEYPYVALGAAALVGCMFAGIFKRRPSPRERIYDALAESIEDVRDNLRSSIEGAVGKKGGLGKTAKAAVTATITKAAIDFAKGKASEMFMGGNAQQDYPRQAGQAYEPTQAMRAQSGIAQSSIGSSHPSTVGS